MAAVGDVVSRLMPSRRVRADSMRGKSLLSLGGPPAVNPPRCPERERPTEVRRPAVALLWRLPGGRSGVALRKFGRNHVASRPAVGGHPILSDSEHDWRAAPRKDGRSERVPVRGTSRAERAAMRRGVGARAGRLGLRAAAELDAAGGGRRAGGLAAVQRRNLSRRRWNRFARGASSGGWLSAAVVGAADFPATVMRMHAQLVCAIIRAAAAGLRIGLIRGSWAGFGWFGFKRSRRCRQGARNRPDRRRSS